MPRLIWSDKLITDLGLLLNEDPLTGIEEAWIEVAERRMDDLILGKVEGFPAKVVFESIRLEMGWNE